MKGWMITFLFFFMPALHAEMEYVEHPPAAKKTRAQWRGDRRVLGQQISLILDWPERPIRSVADPSQVREVSLTFSLKTAKGIPVADWKEILKLRPQGHPSSRNPFLWDLPDDCPQGSLTLTVTAEGVDSEVLPEPLQLRKVDEALAQVQEEYREEMKSWIQEVNHPRLIWGKQPLWPNLDQALSQPEAPFQEMKGFLIRSYQNPHLRRLQPYTVYVPESLDLSEPAPLMILLHGSGGDYRNLIADYAAGQRFEEHPMLIANAGAFRNTEFRHMVLEDVHRIIEDMKSKYPVDPDRIYAQGISLGGRGVLELAALMPDTFAAVSSQGSYGVHHEWMDPLYPLQVDRVAAQLSARNDLRTWLPNLATTPVEMVFGWKDTSTRPVGALALAIRLQRLGYSIVERGFPTGHNLTLPDYVWASTREWFLKHTKTLWPKRIQFRVANLRHNQFSWVRVDALHDPSGVGHVEARMTPKGPVVEVENIAALTLISPPEEEAGFTFPEQQLFFDAEGDQVGQQPLVHSGSVGPLWDIFCEPVLFVVDTEVSADLSKRLEATAHSHARTDATPAFRFPVRTLKDLTDEERTTHNLILYTTTNSPSGVHKEIRFSLPDEVKELRESTDTLTAIRRSPWSEKHKVVVIEAGSSSIPSLYHAGIFQEPLQADWILWKSSRGIRAAGSFHADGRPGPWTSSSFMTRVITR